MDLNENGESMVEIPQQLLILYTNSPLMSLVQFVYPDFVLHMRNPGYFDDGAILFPTNDYVEEVNNFMLSLLSGEKITYLSLDIPCQSNQDEERQSEWFTSEFFNEIKC